MNSTDTTICINIPTSYVTTILTGTFTLVFLSVVNIVCPFVSNMVQNRTVHNKTSNLIEMIVNRLGVQTELKCNNV